jgi:hypothetical protein
MHPRYRKFYRWLCWLAVVAASRTEAQVFVPGQSCFGENNYIEYVAGNLPLILSAPHGGLLSPAAIPDRTCNGCSTVNDFNTQELARALSVALHERTGCYPHLVINRLHRRKLDANRDLLEAADGNPLAEQAWADFHQFLETAHFAVEDQSGKGFYIDLHGHAHTRQRLELGYLLSKSELQLSDTQLDANDYSWESSIEHLSGQNAGALSFSQLLRGTHSLGARLQVRGYPAVPSPADPFPQDADAYFNGGYNTARYSSFGGGRIDGVQIECNRTGIRDSLAQVERFADTLAVALIEYLQQHYFGPVFNGFCGAPAGTATAEVQVWPNPYCETFWLQTPDISGEWSCDIYDFYGNFRKNYPLEPGVPREVALKRDSNLYLIFRKDGAIAQTLPLMYCK